jgi:hypothetical protein
MSGASLTCVCILSIDHVTQGGGVAKRETAASDSSVARLCRQLAEANLPLTLGLATAPSD